MRHARDGVAAGRGLAFVRDEAFGEGRCGMASPSPWSWGGRDAALARLRGAGWPARALDARASGCVAAARFVAALLLPIGPAITGVAAARMCRVLHRGRS